MTENVNSRLALNSLVYGLVLVVVLTLAFYDPSLNPDLVHYKTTYAHAKTQFEFGYDAVMLISRNLFHLSFEAYWAILVVFVATTIVVSYRTVSALIFAVPSLIAVSQVFVGTQMRFGIAVALILFASSLILSREPRNNYAWLIVALAPMFHYGALPLVAILVVSTFVGSLPQRHLVIAYVVCGISIICVAILMSEYTADVLHFFGKPYEENSAFLSRKSVLSTIYALIFFAVVCVLLVRLSDTRSAPLLIFAGIVASTVVGFSGVAVVSGRYQQFSWLLEGMIIWRALTEGRQQKDWVVAGLGAFLFILSCSKLAGIELQLSHLPRMLPI